MMVESQEAMMEIWQEGMDANVERRSPNEEEVDHSMQVKKVQKMNVMSNDELRSSRNKIAITNSSYIIQSAITSKTAMGERGSA